MSIKERLEAILCWKSVFLCWASFFNVSSITALTVKPRDPINTWRAAQTPSQSGRWKACSNWTISLEKTPFSSQTSTRLVRIVFSPGLLSVLRWCSNTVCTDKPDGSCILRNTCVSNPVNFAVLGEIWIYNTGQAVWCETKSPMWSLQDYLQLIFTCVFNQVCFTLWITLSSVEPFSSTSH